MIKESMKELVGKTCDIFVMSGYQYKDAIVKRVSDDYIIICHGGTNYLLPFHAISTVRMGAAE